MTDESNDLIKLKESAFRRCLARPGNCASFPAVLPPPDSDMAAQVFKDPYWFDFIGTADPRREREVEQAICDHIQAFLLEWGAGFAFMGRQVHLEVESQDFYLDLLFYPVPYLRHQPARFSLKKNR